MLGYESIELPGKLVRNIITTEVPPPSTIHPHARIALSRACVVFVNYITSVALESSRLKRPNSQNLIIQDIECALKTTGFENFVPEAIKYIQSMSKGTKRTRFKKESQALENVKLQEEESNEEEDKEINNRQ